MTTSNNKMEDAEDDTPGMEVIPPLRKGEGNNGEVKMVPSSRDTMASRKTPSTAQKQTSIASYFATARGGPLSVAQLGQVGGGVVSDTVEKFRKIEYGRQRQVPEKRDASDPSSGGTKNQNGKTELMKMTFSRGGSKVSTRIKQLQEAGKIVCVMGSGRCGAHNVKLTKSVKSKKISCVEPGGGIGWKYVDLTCLIAPKKWKVTLDLVWPRINRLGAPVRKGKFLQIDAMNSGNQTEHS